MYVRDKKRRPIGCVVAVECDGLVAIGASKCNDLDPFDKHIATDLAVGRAAQALCGIEVEKPAHTCNKVMDIVRRRAKSYYKNSEVIN